ncbi:Non-functional NADPH-dependent codeinone reductase 2 [Camellia lanceoleosa]|uniref:Non-functional NADPH-dependent codeinone reductase 2 n=1 Tax=Camellia lanceoleosa TaxID=1840588 RepID=A0ACC0I8D6_9ERIC|nr:Non-functional NADPH-dependent codeinone reductase 2 [Camellia lanceoleosa]
MYAKEIRKIRYVFQNIGKLMKSTPDMSLCSSTTTDHKQIPLLGFGTAVYPFVSSETMKQSILQAIKFGYRHFDSAALYRSEQPLGEAIADAIRLGFIQSRQDLFITSKLWCSDAHRDHVLPAIQKSLKNLGLEYLDLYLVHWPVSSKPGKYELPVNKQELLPLDFKSVWEAMEECHSLGLTKSIGVSNFSCKKLQLLLSTAKIPPAVNQVEMNPLWQQMKLRDFCEKNGIHVTAYSPLGAKGTLWGSNQVMECEVLKQIAKARGKSVAQVCLRWVYEQGVSVLVKSFNEERIKENLHIFDWELSAQDSEMINQIPQRKGFPGVEFISDVGPYKSLQDLWDGEIP